VSGGVVVWRIPTYLRLSRMSPMPEVTAPTRVPAWPLLAFGAAAASALLGTVLLWAYYGTTVFFETIRAGFVACFG